MKNALCLLLCLILAGSVGCTLPDDVEQKQYTATFISLFDTVTTVVGKAESEEAFNEKVQLVRTELDKYHKLFDIYNEYDGINNLKTVNDKAALSPVKVDAAIIELLSDCKEYYKATGGVFNPAMGSVLSLWHDAREDGLNDPANARLPDTEDLNNAALHINPDDIIIDTEASTVFFADPELKIDVGGIAKGRAVQKTAEAVPDGLLISVGGNVCATGPKAPDGTPWAVGIQNPDMSNNYLHILNIKSGSVVTSGSYQRAYYVDGKLYHHIIDPSTLRPGELWISVSVVSPDSELADVLSTSLFLLDMENGLKLLEKYDAHAMWVDKDGNKYYSPHFKDFIRN